MKDSSVNEILDKQKQPVKYLVLSGGGATGAGYSGVVQALAENGILEGIEGVSGSSAGAIAASLAATGISPEKYAEISQNTNMKALLGKGFIIHKDGEPLMNLVADTIRGNFAEYLESRNLDGSGILKDLREKVRNPAYEVTFGDLEIMKSVDPGKFKTLIVTATEKDTGRLALFGPDTPEVPISKAVRASAGFPVVFSKVDIGGKNYVDGGSVDNIPMLYFDPKQREKFKDHGFEDISKNPEEVGEALKKNRILAFAFGGGDPNSPANISIYSSKDKIIDLNRFIKFVVDFIVKKLTGVDKYSESEERLHQNLRKNALNTVALNTGKVETLSFDEAQEKARYLGHKAYLQTMEHCANHNIGKNSDGFLPHKNFILSLYEESSSNRSWTGKFKKEKADSFLDLLESGAWDTQKAKENLSEAIILSSVRRTDGKMAADTSTMKGVLKILNDPKTPNALKSDIIGILGIDRENGNLAAFKFQEKDFEKFLSQSSEAGKKTFASMVSKKSGATKAGSVKSERENQQKSGNLGQKF